MFDFHILGKQIVKELSLLIEQSVILTDQNGYIVSSTDASRLDTYHEGAFLAMKNREELHMTDEMCKTLQGVRPGLVMPIVIGDSPIGGIGITGPPSEIEKYAKLVRKVVELFITEFMMRQERERDFRELEFFVLDLFTTDSTIESTEERAKLLNVDMSIYSRVGIIKTVNTLEIKEVEHIIQIQSVHPDLKIIRWGMEKLVLLIPKMNRNQLQFGLADLSSKLDKTTKHSTFIGVGEEKELNTLKDSFHQADLAVQVATNKNQIVFEEDLKLEYLYFAVSEDIRDEFLKRTIAPLINEDELLHTLEVWLQSKGSLQEMANDLHIHKNTLKYRLHKIEEHLHMDFTNKKDLAVIYTALSLYTKK